MLAFYKTAYERVIKPLIFTGSAQETHDDAMRLLALCDGSSLACSVLELLRKHEMGTPADHDVMDEDPRAVYFEQMENGMFVRMALLAKVLRGIHV